VFLIPTAQEEGGPGASSGPRHTEGA
jgi:hypothetical protein